MTSPDTAPLIQLLYLSEALADPGQVTALADAARRKNEALGITGALLYSGGHFAQVLEGPAPAIEATYEAISADPRHRGLRVLLRRSVAHRAFDGWHMALLGIDGGDDPVRSLRAQDPPDPARALRLLEHIEQRVRRAPPA